MKKINYKGIFSKYPSIISAYLFGSRARGDYSAISDHDFAVQLDERTNKQSFTELKMNLIAELCHAIKADNIDLVILNDAPILLKHRILRDRKVLYCRNQLKRIRNEARILIDYLDEKEYEQAFARGVFDRVLEAA